MSFKKFIKLTFFCFPLFVLYWSFVFEPSKLVIRHEIFTWKLEPLRIALFADLHAGSPHIDLNYVDKLILTVNSQKPDLILIAGDLVINGVLGGHTIPIEEIIQRFSKLQSKYGSYSVLGNHDWWNDADKIRINLEKNKIRVLENESLLLSFGTQSKINLVGIGDDFTGHADINRAFSNSVKQLPTIIFTHDPGILLDANKNYTLALAGHMHGGQINLPFIGPIITPGRAPKSWSNGWSETSHGKAFVTKGIGTSILPVRFNAPPEVVIIDLKD